MHYQARLVAKSFDCHKGMMYVREEDLHFMMRVHQRTLIENVNSVLVKRLDPPRHEFGHPF